MPAEALSDSPESIAWEAERLRVTVFLGQSGSAVGPEAWTQVTGEAPETKLERSKARSVQCEGCFASGTLVLKATPARIDWHYSSAVDAGSPMPPEPFIGSYSICADEFVPPISKWLSTCRHVERFAFGAVLHRPVASQEDGYRILAAMLPAVTVDPAASDFMFRINRSRSSDHLDLRINRLCRWSVVSMELIELAVSGDLRTRREPRGRSCRLELDINTEAGRTVDLPPDKLSPLLEELVGLAAEIAEKGDVA